MLERLIYGKNLYVYGLDISFCYGFTLED